MVILENTMEAVLRDMRAAQLEAEGAQPDAKGQVPPVPLPDFKALLRQVLDYVVKVKRRHGRKVEAVGLEDLDPAFADAYRNISQLIETAIGRAHVCTPVTNAHLVCRLLLEINKTQYTEPSNAAH